MEWKDVSWSSFTVQVPSWLRSEGCVIQLPDKHLDTEFVQMLILNEFRQYLLASPLTLIVVRVLNCCKKKKKVIVLFKGPHSAEGQSSLLLSVSKMICSSGLSVLSPFPCSLRVFFTTLRCGVYTTLAKISSLWIMIFTTLWFNWWFQPQNLISWLHKLRVTNVGTCDKSYVTVFSSATKISTSMGHDCMEKEL